MCVQMSTTKYKAVMSHCPSVLKHDTHWTAGAHFFWYLRLLASLFLTTLTIIVFNPRSPMTRCKVLILYLPFSVNMMRNIKPQWLISAFLWNHICLAAWAPVETWVEPHSQLAEQERELKIQMQLTAESSSYTNQSTHNDYKLNPNGVKYRKVLSSWHDNSVAESFSLSHETYYEVLKKTCVSKQIPAIVLEN